jgi:hypothetical protein
MPAIFYPWEEYVSKSSGQVYYHNEQTGQTSWMWPGQTVADRMSETYTGGLAVKSQFMGTQSQFGGSPSMLGLQV